MARSPDWTGCAWLITSRRWSCGTTRPGSSSPTGQAELARATGTLVSLPYALDYLAGFHIQAGELSRGGSARDRGRGARSGGPSRDTAVHPAPSGGVAGQASTAVNLVGAMIRGAHARGEGCAVTAAQLRHGDPVQRAWCSMSWPSIPHRGRWWRTTSRLHRGRYPSWSRRPSRCGRPEVARDAAISCGADAVRQRHRVGEGTTAGARERSSTDGGSAEELYRASDRVTRPIPGWRRTSLALG